MENTGKRLNAEVINIGSTVLELKNEKKTQYVMSTMKLTSGKKAGTLVACAIFAKVAKPAIGAAVTIEAKPTPTGEAFFSLLPIVETVRTSFDEL